MSGNLYQASAQWAHRPADERYASIRELYVACRQYHAATVEAEVKPEALRIEARGNEVMIAGEQTHARMTHYAFGQLCARAGAPASYLRTVPADLAVACLNNGFKPENAAHDLRLQFHKNGGLVCKAITTEVFSPWYNWELAQRLLKLQEQGWKVPPARPAPGQEGLPFVRPATAEDVNAATLGAGAGLSVQIGDPIAPAGLYASDHDLFAFVINPEREIGSGLFRGLFCWNSEVGNKSFGIMTFLFNSVCGNHIVWDVSEVTKLRIRHVGQGIADRASEMIATATKYADADAANDKARINAARSYKLGTDRDSVLNAVFGLRIDGLSKARIENGYAKALEYADAEKYDPNTAWGFAQGLTRLSQSTPYADERTALDMAAGKVIKIAF